LKELEAEPPISEPDLNGMGFNPFHY